MEDDEEAAEHRTLRAMGMTLMGIVLSVALSVAFGMEGAWWLRTLVGVATAVLLVTLFKLGTSQGAKGPIARAADWITGSAPERQRPEKR